jgi:hypothetical protein
MKEISMTGRPTTQTEDIQAAKSAIERLVQDGGGLSGIPITRDGTDEGYSCLIAVIPRDALHTDYFLPMQDALLHAYETSGLGNYYRRKNGQPEISSEEALSKYSSELT